MTENFTLNELLIGVNAPLLSQKMTRDYMTDYHIELYTELAQVLQQIRNVVNVEFQKNISLVILSGLRAVEWELLRKRSGLSQHTRCAVDFTASNCTPELSVEINKWIYFYLNQAYMGGLAIKNPTYKKGKIHKIGFVHIDSRKPTNQHEIRGYGERWKY